MKQVLFFLAVFLLCITSVRAKAEINVSAHDQQSVGITIYNKNLALVKDRRKIDVPKGIQELAFREVSAQIKPETALMNGQDLAVLEQNFEYDLLTPESLLHKYVGREVTMIRRHPTTGEDQPVQVKVLSAGNGVVLQVGDRIETAVSGRLVYPDVPDTLRDRPTLIMQVESQKDGAREVELSYLTGGLSWQADYVAELDATEDHLNLSGWVTVTNESGARYPQAQLQLVAGDVNVVQKDMESKARRPVAMSAVAPAQAPTMAEEVMFEYHLYTLRRPTDIEVNQKKQVALLQAAGVECRKEFLLQGQDNYYTTQAGEIGRKIKVGVFVELKNDQESGLGLPIPGGVFRVYKKDGGGLLQFVGEDRVDHTPEKELIRLYLGAAFDITADKRQVHFKKIAGSGPWNTVFESEYEIKLKNAKKEMVMVKILEPLPGDWEVLGESVGHTKESAHAASWKVAVPPMETAILTYRVRVKY
jgi:hypothetical protein